jgi:hypothetical protein
MLLEFHGTCHALWRSLFMDGRLSNEKRQRVRVILSNRLQSFFITLRARFTEDAEAILQHVEQQASTPATLANFKAGVRTGLHIC